jgi:hypothetical protein
MEQNRHYFLAHVSSLTEKITRIFKHRWILYQIMEFSKCEICRARWRLESEAGSVGILRQNFIFSKKC